MDRMIFENDELKEGIRKIVMDVESRGFAALAELSSKYDHFNLTQDNISVGIDEWKEESGKIDDKLMDCIEKAFDNIRQYALKQNIYRDYELNIGGFFIRDRFIPVEKAGIYVPGGEYPYPSTVLMCAVPAKVAGVKEIFMVTPPGNITPAVLAAAEIAGVDSIYRVGGAQAVAALAMGCEPYIPKVDMIVGPGNKYVQAAKSLLSDRVGIDMIAGPSEVCIIADDKQNPDWIASDINAQAEHAADTIVRVICSSEEMNKKIKDRLSERAYGDILFSTYSDLDNAAEQANYYAPEHLQLMLTEKNVSIIENSILNAGAVFIGSNTPVAFGDYIAGPSHTLPTGRNARFQEGLNVRTFLKKVSFIRCDDEKLEENIKIVERLAEEEGMKFHAESVSRRKK